MIGSAKEEKIQFSLQKACHELKTEILEDDINDDLLCICKELNFADYRCRNFQNRMHYDVIELRDFFGEKTEAEIRQVQESDSKTK